MEATGQQDPPGQRTEVDAPSATGQGDVVKRKPVKDIGDSVAEDNEDILEDIRDLELDAEDLEGYSVPADIAFPEKNPVSNYEAEDWDKELAEIEYNNNPYDTDDVIFCGSVQDQNPVALCSVQEEPLYDPSSHHVAPVTVRRQKTKPVNGQFDDAVD
ncbi:coordinator of PRMT5 and differentiation stimulator [Heteronotia binoei]|uniref:coordinator of PRMT5 and differentiation stimulator n=1 Tax=Heteronotia binoei TaxID=13085 RepID=UPI00292F5321|nr:coordinator of PRMT5 and differentiation stimulator [Heteronotia binoei]